MRMTLFVGLLIAVAPAQTLAQGDLTYWQDIRPIFRKHCIACHSSK